MRRSIFAKVFLGYLLIIVILTLLLLGLSFKTIRGFYLDNQRRNLESITRFLSPLITPLIQNEEFWALDSMVKDLGRDSQTRITIVLPDGKVIADSDKDPSLMENHRERIEIKQALNRPSGSSLRYSETVETNMLYVASSIIAGDQILGVLRVSLYLESIKKLLDRLMVRIISISLILLFIALLVSYTFSRGLLRPIKALSDASRQIAQGDLDNKVLLYKNDELGDLAKNFNLMTEELKNLVTKLSQKQDQLTSIISSIQTGLLVINKKGAIILCNKSLEEMVNVPEPEGKLYWEVIREPNLVSMLRSPMESKAVKTGEISLNDRIFSVSITSTGQEQELVVVFHDITALKNLERVKKDFVVNVSHELRTPLTSIKGYLSILEEMCNSEQGKYLEVVKRHTERLISIVQDLLVLSSLEERKPKLNIVNIHAQDLIENMKLMFGPRISEKNLKLRVELDPELHAFRGDFFYLEEMLGNLVDNAIKYTEKGEIHLYFTTKDSNVVIEVRDTGIGIGAENLDRIFERFYVVDKSRSREMGGTGLGLSIVKHIVLLHSGDIRVKSIPGEGTVFTITIPLSFS
ncbi:HAMP domain-containing protein [bacterium]|nr:HAMP domain-containing protein [bacterium]